MRELAYKGHLSGKFSMDGLILLLFQNTVLRILAVSKLGANTPSQANYDPMSDVLNNELTSWCFLSTAFSPNVRYVTSRQGRIQRKRGFMVLFALMAVVFFSCGDRWRRFYRCATSYSHLEGKNKKDTVCLLCTDFLYGCQ